MLYRNNILYLLIFFIITSCSDDFLDRPPLDKIGTDSYWRTSNDLENYVIQFYGILPTHLGYDNAIGYEIRNSDNLIYIAPNNEMNGTRGASSGRWTNDWSEIRGVNIFFDNYQKCEDDFENYKQYLGEAHFFRAWFYFELVKKYGDLPWVNTELFPESVEELLQNRQPRTVVVDSILADLEKAKEYLPLLSEGSNLRLNKETALAFISRIALYEGSWQKYHAGTDFATSGADPNKYFQTSVTAAEELMNGNYSVGLFSDYYESFGQDDMSDNEEIFFHRAYNLSDGFGNDVQYATITNPVGNGITWSMVSSYLDKSGQPFDYLEASKTLKGNAFLSHLEDQVDPRFFATIWTPGALMIDEDQRFFDKPFLDQVSLNHNPTGFQLKKFSNPSSIGAGKGGAFSGETGYIFFRHGEVLLNYAESLYELKGEVAYEALNQLRLRAGMPEFKIIPQDQDPNLEEYGYSISDALYEIRRERKIELAYEGFRANDYKRWAAHALFKNKRPKGYPFDQSEFPNLNVLLDENGLIDYFQEAMPNGYQFRENQDYLNSIPLEELTLNPSFTQNPGW